jgi:hypothetical protein
MENEDPSRVAHRSRKRRIGKVYNAQGPVAIKPGRKDTLMTTAISTSNKHTVYDWDAKWLPVASWHVPKPASPVVKITEQVVYVCFPIVLPGEDGCVIPFGRYRLTTHRLSKPQSGLPHQSMLVNGDNAVRICLSTQQLNYIAQDTDVEIY